ncbi:MAG: adenosylmethionine--8-amino-7-oxononanoate transaminase [Verrucomicrobia bacterium]|nr:adenosylmethionine--8-amino-7-oxononanoate transaminase [Verrucomicrobiota bacterium]
MATQFLIENDQNTVWHPFTHYKKGRQPIPIAHAKGAYLYTPDRRAILDGISSWWVNLHGHAHPYIAQKIKEQADILEHVIFADFTHLPAVELAQRLLPFLPGKMGKIFYSDNGSTAVETALKIALQYWHNQNIQRTKVVCLKDSYHGDTFGAMSAAGKNPYNRPFWSYLFDVEQIEPHCLEILEKGDVACFIFEPLILGAGGMKIYSKEHLRSIFTLCKKHRILTIADEVMTGFGRTGPLFACEGFSPDLICLSKGITGGFLPLGVTACTEEIFSAFHQNAFLHGHSYTGNPIVCTAALASLDLLLQEECTLARQQISDSHRTFCQKWSSHPKLKRCESLGTILVLEYHSVDRDQLYDFFLSKDILLRPLGNVLYVMPPYCIKKSELERIYEQIVFTLEN